MYQGSVLSLLLFILEALSREFREGLPTKLLYGGLVTFFGTHEGVHGALCCLI